MVRRKIVSIYLVPPRRVSVFTFQQGVPCSLSLLLLDWVKMVEGVEVLAHGESLLPLDRHLFLREGSQEHEDGDGVEDGPVLESWHDSGSHDISEEALVHVEQVGGREEASKKRGGEEHSLGVVHSIADSLVMLPLVIILICLFISI